MSFFKSILSNKKLNIEDISVKYNKTANNWLVVKDSKVLYMGDEPSCKDYIEGLSTVN